MNNLQKVIYNIYKEVLIVCDRHDIPFYAIGGTCIGAIRHNGFIPWDDDLDIAIPIEHFDSFIRYAKEELPKHLYVLTPKSMVHYPNHFIKVCDDRTTFVMESSLKYRDSYKGVFVDVMPISGIPKKALSRFVFIWTLRCLDVLNNTRRYGSGVVSSLLKVFHFDLFSSLYHKILWKHPFYSSQFTSFTWFPSFLNRGVFETKYFGIPKPHLFEDTVMMVPCNYHEYLTFQFGDYMVIPDTTDQETHGGLIDLNISYKKYQESFNE